MPVYMIQGENRFGPVKIGHSHDPEVRLGQLQISHWEELQIIRLFDGGEAEEDMLHAKFADLYMRGEWHAWSPGMLGDVGLTEIVTTAETIVPAQEPEHGDLDQRVVGSRLYHWLRASKITQREAAVAIGANQPVFSHWCSGLRRVPANQAVKINRILGVPLHEMRPDLWSSIQPQASTAA